MTDQNMHGLGQLVHVILATVFLSGITTVVYSQTGCATELGSPQERQAFIQRHEAFLASEPFQRSSTLGTYKWIPVYFHILRKNDGSGGISLADARSALSNCNSAFAATNIRLYECGYQYHNNSTYYEEFDKETEQVGMINAYNIDSVANVYIVNELAGGSGGFAKFPDVFSPGLSVNNYMVIDRNNMDDPDESTMQHEFGHFFDLPHTHETAYGNELVNGSNCSTAGDLFCDTPADPRLECGVFGNVDCGLFTDDCNYCGSATDANGNEYAPNTMNIMSYSCKECRTEWSPLQIAKMNYTVSDDGPLTRRGLNCTNCSATTYDLPFAFGLFQVMGEYYRHDRITSSTDLTGPGVVLTADDLTFIATDNIKLFPGFSFSALDPDLTRFQAIIDPCGSNIP